MYIFNPKLEKKKNSSLKIHAKNTQKTQDSKLLCKYVQQCFQNLKQKHQYTYQQYLFL